jgi:hypothetical protein
MSLLKARAGGRDLAVDLPSGAGAAAAYDLEGRLLWSGPATEGSRRLLVPASALGGHGLVLVRFQPRSARP